MRLTTVILIASLMQVSAATFGQRITLSQKDTPLKSVLREITRQSGYGFFYDGKVIKDNQRVTITLSDAEFDEALRSVLTGLNLSYKIDGKIVSIKKEEPGFIDKVIARFQAIDVRGRVVDASGQALPGASIKVKGSNKAASTNTKGEFYLQNVEEGAVLLVSFVGYVNKEVIAQKEMGDIALELSLSKLDEVQVIAYGTTTQRLSTGNVSTVKAADIEKAPVGNPLLALQGRVPGIMITQMSGVAGSAVTVRIQGENSMRNGNEPFYVIDGLPYQFKNTIASSGVLQWVDGSSGSPFNFINPGDIESIDVLKDADATAIYGSRAANGAILITTKKGKTGELKIDFNLQQGASRVARKLEMMNTQQYLDMRKEALRNDGITIPSSPTPAFYDLTLYDQNRYTDWQKVLIGKAAHYTDLQGSLSGGNAALKGILALNYHRENSVFPGEFRDQKGGGHLTLSGSSKNTYFQYQFTSSYLLDVNKLPGYDLTDQAIKTIPNAPALYQEDGSLNWEEYNGNGTWTNPLGKTLNKFSNKIRNLSASGLFSYRVLKGLELKSSLGYNNTHSDAVNLIPQISFSPIFNAINFRSSSFANAAVSTVNIEPQLTYSGLSKFGKIDVLIGSTYSNTKDNSLITYATGFKDDSQLENIAMATNISAYRSLSEYRYNAVFGRLNYNYNDKYLLNLSTRRDGSSRFGPENMVNSFYAVAGAWIFSEEKWYKKNRRIFSYGKLKISYGTSGNDQIGDYKFMSLYEPFYADIPYGGGKGLKPTGHSNPYLQWEETRKLNVGVDLGVFNDGLTFGLNYYKNRSSNQLLRSPLPIITGFGGIVENRKATVQNSGFEFVLNASSIKKNNFTWSTSFNISLNRNKLLAYENLAESSYRNYLIIGKPTTIIRAYAFAGVDPQTGVYQFRKADGSLTFSPSDPEDMSVIIDKTPKYFGGWSNSLTYKGFSLDLLFQFVKQKGVDPARFGIDLPPGSYSSSLTIGNQPTSVSNYWKQQGDISSIQKLNSNYSSSIYNAFNFASLSSDYSYVDASFIRLKNLSFSWNLPKQLINKARFQSLRVYIQGQNLLTFTPYKGMDPESTSYGFSLPPLQTLTFGLQLSI